MKRGGTNRRIEGGLPRSIHAVRPVAGAGAQPKRHRRPSQPGSIPRRGDHYLRTLLVQGAKSVVNTANTRTDPISRWALALKERSGWQKAVVALANKNARILRAVMTREQRFDRNHVNTKPERAMQPSHGANPSAAAMA